MTSKPNTDSIFQAALASFRASWKSLAITDIVFKLIGFVVLTPLVGVLLRTLIAFSGKGVLSDQDILFFLIGPVGWICFILVAAFWLGIVALEQSSLMAVVCAKNANKQLSLLGALRFAAVHAAPVVRVTLRIASLTLLAMAPFAAIAAVVYLSLLTEYDINYYLKEKPPVFLAALGIGGLLLAVLTALLLRLFSNWFFAIPLVLFEGVSPVAALRESQKRIHGHRKTTLGWIVGWLVFGFLLSAIATSVVGLVGRVIVPDVSSSLQHLSIAIGMLLLGWALLSLAVNLLCTTSFAAMLFSLYERFGSDGGDTAQRLHLEEIEARSSPVKLTRRKFILAGVLGSIVAIGIGIAAALSVTLDDNVKIMAHRGSSKAAPENTLAAIRQAIEEGADWVEIDVQETADGQVVVFHDSDFMKLANVNLKIWDATMDDLKDIDIGSWFGPEFADQRVPTFAEVLRECKDKIGVNIELKYYGHDVQLEQRVAEIVDEHGMASQVVAMSLKLEGVKKMKSVRPDWRVGLLMSVVAGGVKNIQADFLAVNASFANRKMIRRAHRSGKEIYVWTVNDAPTMSTMIGRGVDALLTDKPALARSVLEQRKKMSVPERLVLELSSVLGQSPEIEEQ